MTKLSGYARLGQEPEIKTIGDGDEKQTVCELSVKFINRKKKKNSDEDDEYDDLGFWTQVNVWGFEAEPAAKLLSKGDKVFIVDGKLAQRKWDDKENPDQEKSALQIECRLIFPVLSNLDSLNYKPRQTYSE